jgi:hypothetical protein
MSNTLICNKTHTNECGGEVTYWTRPSDSKSFPKCAKHHEKAVTEFERIDRTYGITSNVPPAGFDPLACGEVW